MQPIEIDQSDAQHAERAVVQRGLAVRFLVVGRERIAVEIGPCRLGPAHAGVGRVGERVDLRVAEHHPEQVEQVGVRARERIRRAKKAGAVVRLRHLDRSGKPAKRRLVVVRQGRIQRREARERLAVARAEVHQPVLGAVVELLDEQRGLEALDIARAEVGACFRGGLAVVATDDLVVHASDLVQCRVVDFRDRRFGGVVHHLQVVDDPQPVLPRAEAVGSGRDDLVDLLVAVGQVQARRVALVVGADQRAGGAGIVVRADRAAENRGTRRIDRRIEAPEHMRGRPDAWPAERIVRGLSLGERVPVAVARVVCGVCSSGKDEAPERVARFGEVLDPVGEQTDGFGAGAAVGIDERSVDERGSRARLERDVVHRLLGVLVALHACGEAGQIDPGSDRAR